MYMHVCIAKDVHMYYNKANPIHIHLLISSKCQYINYNSINSEYVVQRTEACIRRTFDPPPPPHPHHLQIHLLDMPVNFVTYARQVTNDAEIVSHR